MMLFRGRLSGPPYRPRALKAGSCELSVWTVDQLECGNVGAFIQEHKVDSPFSFASQPLHTPDEVTVVSAMTAAQITDIPAGKKEASPFVIGNGAKHLPRSLCRCAGVAAKAKIVFVAATCAQALKFGYPVFAALCRRLLLSPAHSRGRRTKRLPG